MKEVLEKTAFPSHIVRPTEGGGVRCFCRVFPRFKSTQKSICKSAIKKLKINKYYHEWNYMQATEAMVYFAPGLGLGAP